uniref:DNA dC->dU-editing enzyme APOBEC-3G n=1 Tax=Canis lupus familiaris TaxID=9615 RepID=A0A8C0TNP1_CANLF
MSQAPPPGAPAQPCPAPPSEPLCICRGLGAGARGGSDTPAVEWVSGWMQTGWTPPWRSTHSHGIRSLTWGGGGQHAEWFLLEHIRSRNLDQKLSYKVTCFLSWTPCEKCAEEIIRFLAKNRHVSLSILGLRELYDAGVHISIMTFRDFEYCWQTFVDHQDSPFQPWADLDRRSQQLSQQLRAILQAMGPEESVFKKKKSE